MLQNSCLYVTTNLDIRTVEVVDGSVPTPTGKRAYYAIIVYTQLRATLQ